MPDFASFFWLLLKVSPKVAKFISIILEIFQLILTNLYGSSLLEYYDLTLKPFV